MKEENAKRIIWYARLIGIVLGIILVIGISYSIFRITKESNKTNVFKVGALSLVLDESSKDGITIMNASPINVNQTFEKDDNLYTFSLKNNGHYNLNYSINIVSEEPSDTCRIPDNNGTISETPCIKMNNKYIYYAIKDTTKSEFVIKDLQEPNSTKMGMGWLKEDNTNKIYSGTINAGETQNFDLRLNLSKLDINDKEVTYDMVKGSEFVGKITVIAEQSIPKSIENTKTKYPIVAKVGENITATIDKENGTLTYSGMGEFYDSGENSIFNYILVDSYKQTKYEECANPDEKYLYIEKVNSITVGLTINNESYDTALENLRKDLDNTKQSKLENDYGTDNIDTIIARIDEMAKLFPKYNKIVISEGITSLGKSIATGVVPITSITLPQSLTTISDLAFCCSRLTNITIGENVKTIGEAVFNYSPDLTSITIIGNKDIKESSFMGINNLKESGITLKNTNVTLSNFYLNN